MKINGFECTDHVVQDGFLHISVKCSSTDLGKVLSDEPTILDDDGNLLQTYSGFEFIGATYNNEEGLMHLDYMMGPEAQYQDTLSKMQAQIDAYGDVLEDILITMYSEDEDGSEN